MIFEVLLPTQQEINQHPLAIYKSEHFGAWGNVAESYQARVLSGCDNILHKEVDSVEDLGSGPASPTTQASHCPPNTFLPHLANPAPGSSAAVFLRVCSLFLRILRCKGFVKKFLKEKKFFLRQVVCHPWPFSEVTKTTRFLNLH